MNPSAPANPPGLSAAQLEQAFPFYLAWDRNLRLVAIGPSLHKVCPDAALGLSLPDLFELKRPAGELSDAFFRANPSLLVLLCRGGGILPACRGGSAQKLPHPAKILSEKKPHHNQTKIG